MSESLSKTAVSSVNTSAISDAVWEFMTSVKSVLKRDGQEESFDAQKLSASIRAAFEASGMKNPKLIEKVTSQVMSRLTKQFDGHSIPTVSDVREVVEITCIDNNLSHIAKTYAEFRTRNTVSEHVEKYGHGISVDRYFTKEGVHPYDEITWEKRDAVITNSK